MSSRSKSPAKGNTAQKNKSKSSPKAKPNLSKKEMSVKNKSPTKKNTNAFTDYSLSIDTTVLADAQDLRTLSAATALLKSQIKPVNKVETQKLSRLDMSAREMAIADAYSVPVMPFSISKYYLDYGLKSDDRWWSADEDKPESKALEFTKPITLLNDEKVSYIRKNDSDDNNRKRFFIQRSSGKVYEIDDVNPALMPLYNIEALEQANAGDRVIICEGVPATDALIKHNILAVGSFNALHVPPDEVLTPLLDKKIYLWPDNDDIGVHYMAKFFKRLKALGAAEVKLIKWRDGPWRGDAANFTGSAGALKNIIEAADEWPPSLLERSDKGVFLSVPDSPYSLRASYQPANNTKRII